jgi:hypothetical protein
MRGLLILGGVGVLSAAAWIITAGTGALAQDQGEARVHGAGGRGGHTPGFTGPMKHGSYHPANLGLAFHTEVRELFAGQPEPGPPAPGMLPLGDLGVGRPGHLIAGPQVAASIHPLTHVPMRFEGDEAANPQPAAPIADDSDRAGAATAQPDPSASPLPPRPPGAGGPGRPVSGWSSPRLPGTERAASPRR